MGTSAVTAVTAIGTGYARVLAFGAASTPDTPADSTAQEWAEQEIAKTKYHGEESLLEKLINWVAEHLQFRIGRLSNESSAGLLIAILAIIAAIVIIVLIVRAVKLRDAGKATGSGAPRLELFGDIRSSAELLAEGAAARAAGNYAAAIIDNFRGVVRLLEERQLLLVRPGLTATEAAREGGSAIQARELFIDCANWFNRVYFAGEAGTPAALAKLDRLITAAASAGKLPATAKDLANASGARTGMHGGAL